MCVTRPVPCQGLLAGQLARGGLLCTDPLTMSPRLWEDGQAARGPLSPYGDEGPAGWGWASQWGCGTDRVRPEARKEKGGPSRVQPASWVSQRVSLGPKTGCEATLSPEATHNIVQLSWGDSCRS